MKRTLGFFVGLLLCVSHFVPFLVEAQSGNQSDAELASLLSVIQNIVSGLKQQVQQLTQGSVGTAYAQTADITTGLVGYWRFDEGSGTTASDSSGNNHAGVLTNGPTWTTGKIGGAVRAPNKTC